MRSFIPVVLAALGLTAGAGVLLHSSLPSADARGADAVEAGGQDLEITREPVVIFDQTGSSLLGSVHRSLVIYNDGHASFSERVFSGFPGPDGELVIDSRTAFIDSESLLDIRHGLGNAGAATLGDAPFLIIQAPLSTVTFFRNPGTVARANTFSFTGGEEYNDVHDVLFGVINEYFPPLPPGDG